MPKSSSQRQYETPVAFADVETRPKRPAVGQRGRRFGPREQQDLIEAAYSQPEPHVAEYSGFAKVSIFALGGAASWGVVFLIVRLAGRL